MWQIEEAIYAAALIMAALNSMLFCMWWDYKKVMLIPHRKNLARFYVGLTVLLTLTLLINTFYVCRAGGSTQWEFALGFIIAQAIAAYGVIWILKGNYDKYLVEGQEYHFLVASAGEKFVGGYLIVGKYWVYAEDVNPYDPEEFKELTTVKAVLIQTDKDGKVIVRL